MTLPFVGTAEGQPNPYSHPGRTLRGLRHHAHKSLASGFCYVNDCVLALLVLRRASPSPPLSSNPGNLRKKSRVMYLDLDVHYGDGVAAAFRGAGARGQVLTLSVHHAALGFFPASEHSALPDISSDAFDPFTLALPLHAGASCATFTRVWRTVDRILEAFAPDYIVLQCGVDGLAEDPVGAWNWALDGEGGLAWWVQRVLDFSAKVLLLGGGIVLTRPRNSHVFDVLPRWVYSCQHRPCVGAAYLYCGASVARVAYSCSRLFGQCGVPLAPDTPIPNHAGFPMYAPSFILDVPASNVRDENTDEYLTKVDATFEDVAKILRTLLA